MKEFQVHLVAVVATASLLVLSATVTVAQDNNVTAAARDGKGLH